MGLYHTHSYTPQFVWPILRSVRNFLECLVSITLLLGLNLGLMSLDQTELKIVMSTGTELEKAYAKVNYSCIFLVIYAIPLLEYILSSSDVVSSDDHDEIIIITLGLKTTGLNMRYSFLT